MTIKFWRMGGMEWEKIETKFVFEMEKFIFALANRIGFNGTEFLFIYRKAPCGCSSGTQRLRSNGSVCSAWGDLFPTLKTANR